MATKLQQVLTDAENSGKYYVAPGETQNSILKAGETHAVLFGDTQKHVPTVYNNRALGINVLLALEPQSPETPNVYTGTILPFNGPVTVNELAIALGSDALIVSKVGVEASWFKTMLLRVYHTPSSFLPEEFSSERKIIDGMLPINQWVYVNIYFTGVQPLTHAETTERLESEGFKVLNPLYGLSGFAASKDEWSIGDEGIVLLLKTDKLIRAVDLEVLPVFDDLAQIGGQVWFEAETSARLEALQGYTDTVYWTKSGEAVVGGVVSTVGEAAGSASAALDLTSDALGSLNSMLKALKKHGTVVMVSVGVLAAAAGGYWLYKRNKKSKKSKKKGG